MNFYLIFFSKSRFIIIIIIAVIFCILRLIEDIDGQIGRPNRLCYKIEIILITKFPVGLTSCARRSVNCFSDRKKIIVDINSFQLYLLLNV